MTENNRTLADRRKAAEMYGMRNSFKLMCFAARKGME